MPFIDRNGTKIHWEERGEGTPLLLVMGATYSSAMWWPVVDVLSASHRVITFDNRGTGESEASKVASISDMANDGIAVLDAAGVDRAHVFGVSLGGVVVIQLALEHPDRVTSLLVGCSGILSDAKPRAPKWLQSLFYIPVPVRNALLGFLGKRGDDPVATPERAARNAAVLAAEKTVRQGLIAQQEALRAYSVSPEQVRAGLTMPLLVQHGTNDKTVKPEWGAELAATVPGARHLTYEGAGHNYLVDDEQSVLDAGAFFAEVDAAAIDTRVAADER